MQKLIIQGFLLICKFRGLRIGGGVGWGVCVLKMFGFSRMCLTSVEENVLMSASVVG